MNGRETEVKFYVRDLASVEMRLLELKAHLIQERIHEVNYRFDDPGGGLRKSGKVLRLRKDSDAKFTFKGPGEENASGILSRKEIEFTVGSFDGAMKFLESLGFTPILFYEKFRATYELNGLHIMLDELPYGNFVEIEGEDGNALREIAGLLGLNWNAMVRAGYHALFERIAEKYNLDPARLSFEAFKTVRVNGEDMSIIPAD